MIKIQLVSISTFFALNFSKTRRLINQPDFGLGYSHRAPHIFVGYCVLMYTNMITHTYTPYINIYIYILYTYITVYSSIHMCARRRTHAYIIHTYISCTHHMMLEGDRRSSSPRTFLLKKVRYSSPFISKAGSNLVFCLPLSPYLYLDM